MFRKLLRIYKTEGYTSIFARIFFKFLSFRKNIFNSYVLRYFYPLLLSPRPVVRLMTQNRQISQEDYKKIIKLSSSYMSHKFYIFSEFAHQLNYSDGKGICWRRDHRSGYTWEKSIYFTKIVYGNEPGIDVKVPWELSRLLFLPTVALAARYTRDKVYIEFIKSTLHDFERDNPFLYGVNWKCTMDVSIRLINLLVTQDLAEGRLDESPNNVDMDSLAAKHFLYIIHNLEWVPFNRGNHYYSNLVGVLAYLRYTKIKDRRIVKRYVSEFLSETSLQFHDDGTNFEASTTYHCLSFELFTLGYACCRYFISEVGKLGLDNDNLVFSESLQSKAAKFISDIHCPKGEILQIGDNDSGYVLELEFDKYDNKTLSRNYLDYKHLSEIDGLRLDLYKSLGPV